MDPPQQMCTVIELGMFCFVALADVNDDTIYSDFTENSQSGLLAA